MTEAHNVQVGETALVHTVEGWAWPAVRTDCQGAWAKVIRTTDSTEKAEIVKRQRAGYINFCTGRRGK